MRLAPLTNVTDDSRTMLRDGLAPRRGLSPWARTNDVSVISALPFIGVGLVLASLFLYVWSFWSIPPLAAGLLTLTWLVLLLARRLGGVQGDLR